jgi:hypothetical protein
MKRRARDGEKGWGWREGLEMERRAKGGEKG